MKIILETYQQNWSTLYLNERTIISNALQRCSPTVEHIGSTSITGMVAKPTIDILVGLNKEEHLDKSVTLLQTEGYTYIKKYESEWPTRRFFMKLQSFHSTPPSLIDTNDNYSIGKDFYSLANIHIILKDTTDWRRHIAFRDFLRSFPAVREEYIRLKRRLAEQNYKDTNEYSKAKSFFINQTEKIALEWFTSLSIDK